MKALMSSRGKIDSALNPEGAGVGARLSVGYTGEVCGMGVATPGEPCCDSSRAFLMASACLFGGPRRRLGLSYVQGISSAAHARHGGPASSHYKQPTVNLEHHDRVLAENF